MNQSLSIILPVCNAELTLTDKINELLDVVSELSASLELLIVDNGSTDNTEEVAMELSTIYPQVSILRQTPKVSDVKAAKAGIEQTTGDVVLIHDIETTLSGNAIQQFWAMRDDEELVFARSEEAHSGVADLRGTRSGTQMLRRSAVTQLQQENAVQPVAPPAAPKPQMRIDRVTRTDLGDTSSGPASIVRQLTGTQHTQLK